MSQAASESTPETANQKQGKYETLKTVAIAVSLAVIFRSFVFEPFHIPSGSMKDTLLVGDYIFVSKYSYGYSRYSLPLGLPLWKGRVFDGTKPQRGDIIVFRPPYMPRTDYIKRLIGLPGDTVQVRGGLLYINGEAVKRERVDDYLEREEKDGQVHMRPITKYTEILPNGVAHGILDDIANGEVDDTQVYRVPDGHYFFMGDNRDHSLDSRYLDRVGFVPEENLVGRAEIIAISVQEGESMLAVWKWPSIFRLDRFFTNIRVHPAQPEPAAKQAAPDA